MKKIKAIGIDYSLNSPAICISNGSMKFKDCTFHFLTDGTRWFITGLTIDSSECPFGTATA